MLKKYIPLLFISATVLLVASCSSSDPLLDETETNIQDENYTAAKTAADNYIQQNPGSPLGYYWKGVALGQEAQGLEMPDQATPLYKQMNTAFTKAQENAANGDEKPDELERISPFKLSLWRTEHNTAVNFATDDSIMQVTENPLQISLGHLTNALIIQPDDTLSLGVYAQVNGMTGNYGEAAKAQEKYLSLKETTDAQPYLLLAQYYRNNDQSEKAIETLEKVQNKYPENTQVVEILADSYSQAGESEKAIAIVEELVEKDPSNTRYRTSLGTQIYQSALELQSSYDENSDQIFDLKQDLKSASDSEKQNIQSQINDLEAENEDLREEIDTLTDRSIEQLNASLESETSDPNTYNTLGIIYQNKAAVLFDLRNMTTDNQQAADLDAQAKEQLEMAMENYEKAAELDPENPKYWRSLFQIYTSLGMDEKAAEAEQKAGMQ